MSSALFSLSPGGVNQPEPPTVTNSSSSTRARRTTTYASNNRRGKQKDLSSSININDDSLHTPSRPAESPAPSTSTGNSARSTRMSRSASRKDESPEKPPISLPNSYVPPSQSQSQSQSTQGQSHSQSAESDGARRSKRMKRSTSSNSGVFSEDIWTGTTAVAAIPSDTLNSGTATSSSVLPNGVERRRSSGSGSGSGNAAIVHGDLATVKPDAPKSASSSSSSVWSVSSAILPGGVFDPRPRVRDKEVEGQTRLLESDFWTGSIHRFKTQRASYGNGNGNAVASSSSATPTPSPYPAVAIPMLRIESEDGNALVSDAIALRSIDASPNTSERGGDPEQHAAAAAVAAAAAADKLLPPKRNITRQRQKKKYLRKGEVDPDDPVAVAKQKERHFLIDSATAELDAQLARIQAGTDDQLLGMLAELEKRRDLQLQHLDFRHQLTMKELNIIQGQEKQQAKEDFALAKSTIENQVIHESRTAKSQLAAERIYNKRTLDKTYPLLRESRGGGGWAVHTDRLLSNGELGTTYVERMRPDRIRRDLPHRPMGLNRAAVEDDLKEMRKNMPAPVEKPPKVASTSSVTATGAVTGSGQGHHHHRPPAPAPNRNHHHHHYLVKPATAGESSQTPTTGASGGGGGARAPHTLGTPIGARY